MEKGRFQLVQRKGTGNGTQGAVACPRSLSPWLQQVSGSFQNEPREIAALWRVIEWAKIVVNNGTRFELEASTKIW